MEIDARRLLPLTLDLLNHTVSGLSVLREQVTENSASGRYQMFERLNAVERLDELLILPLYRNPFHLSKIAKYEIITRMLGQDLCQPPLASAGAIRVSAPGEVIPIERPLFGCQAAVRLRQRGHQF